MPALDARVIPMGGFRDGLALCDVPSPTNPFMASELTKLEIIPQPDDSDEEEEEEEVGALSTLVAAAPTRPPPLCPPFRRSENSESELRKALLTAGWDVAGAGDEDEAMPWLGPLPGAPPFGGLESVEHTAR